jgi:hypothetical protein
LETANASIKEKDRVIQEKNADIVGLRNANQRIKELTEEEKANLTEQQIKDHEEKLLLQKQLEDGQKQIQDYQKREIDGRRNSIFDKLSKGDKNLRDRLELNYSRLKGSDEALTEAEITAFANEAFMLSNTTATPNPINQAIAGSDGGGDGTNPNPTEEGEGFAETEEGKELGGLLGIN